MCHCWIRTLKTNLQHIITTRALNIFSGCLTITDYVVQQFFFCFFSVLHFGFSWFCNENLQKIYLLALLCLAVHLSVHM
jgi:hypothetical protein